MRHWHALIVAHRVPAWDSQGIDVPHDLSCAQGEAAVQPLVPDQLGEVGVQEWELPLLQPEHGQVRLGAHAQGAQLRPAYHLRRQAGGALDGLA